MIPKLQRIRSKRHLKFVGSRTFCCVCGRFGPVHVHHLLCCRYPKARGLKAGDDCTIPLCLYCHTSLHYEGDERSWAKRNGKDLEAIADVLWARSPANKQRAA